MTRYFFVVLLMSLMGIAVVVKAGFIMFAEQGYWKDVADRFVREGVPVKPNRGNILSADGKLMASSLPEYRIYMDFKAGGYQKDTMLMNHLTEICEGLHKIFPDRSAAQFKAHLLKGRKKGSRNYLIYPKRISYIQYKEAKRLPVFNLNKYKGGFHELAYNQRKKPFGSLAARTLGDLYADTAQGAKNGIELAFDSLLKGREGITHRQKVMNKYLNIVDRPPVDGCDIITTLDVDMQDICEKALVDKLKELEAVSGVAILMDVPTGDVKAIVNMTRGQDGNYYEMRNLAISNLQEPGSTFKTASIMVALEDGKITPDYTVDTEKGIKMMYGQAMRVCGRSEAHEHRPATTFANTRRRHPQHQRAEREIFCQDNPALDEYRLRSTDPSHQHSDFLQRYCQQRHHGTPPFRDQSGEGRRRRGRISGRGYQQKNLLGPYAGTNTHHPAKRRRTRTGQTSR